MRKSTVEKSSEEYINDCSDEIIECFNECIAIIDVKGNLLKTNKAWKELSEETSKKYSEKWGTKKFPGLLELATVDYSGKKMTCLDVVTKFTEKSENGIEITYLCPLSESSKWMELKSKVLKKSNNLFLVRLNKVNEKQTLEQEYFDNRQKLFKVLDIAKLGFWEHDLINNELYFNDQFYKMMRTNASEMGGYVIKSEEYINKFLLQYDRINILNEIKDARISFDGYEREMIHKVRFGDGTIGYVIVRFFVSRDENGKPVRAYGVNQDITERVIAEETLKFSEERFAKAFIKSPESIILTSLDTSELLEVNDTFLKITGYNREDVIGKTTLELNIWLKPQDREKYIKKLISSGKIKNFETQFRMKSGEIRDFRVSADSIELANEKCFLHFLLDITENNKSKYQLQESEKKYRLLFENITQGFALHEIITDSENRPIDYRFLVVNSAYEKLTGIKSDKVLGKTVKEVLPKTEDYWIEIFGEVALKRTTKFYENYSVELDKYFEVNSFSPKPGQFAVVISDVTNRKKAEIALKESEEMIRQFAENVDSGFWIIDIKTLKFVYVNKAYPEIFNVTRKSLYENPLDLAPNVHPDDKERMINIFQNLKFLDKAYLDDKFRVISPNGNIKWIRVKSFAILDESGKVCQRAGIVTNITKQEKINEVLSYVAELNQIQDELTVEGMVKNTFKQFKKTFQNESFYIVFVEKKNNINNFKLWILNKNNSELNKEEFIEKEDEIPEIWKECINKRKSIWKSNIKEKRVDYSGQDIEARNEFAVPIFEKRKMKAIIGLFNKKGEFLKEDAEVVELLIDNFWKMLQRKKIEEELKFSEDRYRSIFEGSSAVMLLFNPATGIITDANKMACKYYGYEKSVLLKMSYFDLNIYPTRKIMDEIIKQRDFTRKHFLAKHKTSNNGERDVEIFAGNIIIEKRHFVYCIVYDVTDRREAEKELNKYRSQLEILVQKRTEELFQSEERFRKLSDTSKDYILRINQDFKILYGNPEFANMLGLDAKRIVFSSLRDLNESNVLIEFITNSIESTIKTKNIFRTEFEYPTGFWTDWIFMPEFEDENEIPSVIAFGRDITERRKLELSLEESLEREKELGELKTNFISMASHEFRTPLTAILSSADLLEMFGRKWNEDKYIEHINKIQFSVQEMTSLINDVLVLSSGDFKKNNFDPRITNLKKVCSEIIENCKNDPFFDHELTYIFDSQKEEYLIDGKLIRQLIINLLSNSIKYTPKDGKIYLGIKELLSGHLEITVEDNGYGIDTEDQKRIFEPFFRGGNVIDKPGTGLGLAIVKKAVDAHKGLFDFNSQKGVGTKCTILIPIN